jgi:hypothetical protein
MRDAGLPLAIAAALTAACWSAAGAGLGLNIGGTMAGVLIAPPLVLRHQTLRHRLLALAGVVDGIGLVWLSAVLLSPTSLMQWLGCWMLMAGLLLALAAISIALERLGVNAVVSAAVVVIAALCWLTWPIWLSPHLAGQEHETLVWWLAALHPLLAMNGMLLSSGIAPWTEMAMAYQLTALGQDVPYRLPSQPWTSILAHVLLAVGLLGLAWAADRLREGRDVRLAVDVPDGDEGDGGQ